MTWSSSFGVEYFVFVAGSGGASGQFGITAYEPPPTFSEACLSADTISVDGIPIVGTTLGSPVYTSTTCGAVPSADTGGAWLRVVGTGGEITVDTCDPSTDFDTTVSYEAWPLVFLFPS